MAAPLKATFFAFRRRERGGVLLRATVVHVVLCVALFVVWAILNALIAFGSITGEVTVEVAPSAGPAMHSLLSMVVLIFLYCVVTASYEAACLRWMIRGETGGFAGFSLGGDTWRIYSGYWIWFVIGMASYLPTMLIVTLAARALSAASLEEPILAVVSVYGGLALWSLLIFPLALRFAPGNATSVGQRKFSYFAGWRVSQGRFWALFGSFITLWIVWLFTFVALFFLLGIAVFWDVGDDAANSTEVDVLMYGGIAACFFIANFVLAFLSAGVNARAVAAAIAEGRLDGASEDVAEVFA